jgi:hypothetical protein
VHKGDICLIAMLLSPDVDQLVSVLLLLELSSASRSISNSAACYIQWVQNAVEVPTHQKVAVMRQGLVELLLEEGRSVCGCAGCIYTSNCERLPVCLYVY